jgi:hypothetical protein
MDVENTVSGSTDTLYNEDRSDVDSDSDEESINTGGSDEKSDVGQQCIICHATTDNEIDCAGPDAHDDFVCLICSNTCSECGLRFCENHISRGQYNKWYCNECKPLTNQDIEDWEQSS